MLCVSRNCHRSLAHCCAWHTHYVHGWVCRLVSLSRVGGVSGGVEVVNLPGWRWAMITKVALDRLSRSLHSDVCDSDGCRDAVVHSTISGRRGRRLCAAPNILYKNWTFTFVPSPFHKSRFPTLYIAFTKSEPVETTVFVDCTRTGSLL